MVAKQVVPCDIYGTLKPFQLNDRTAEANDLLVNLSSSAAPSTEQLQAILDTVPSASGLARVAQNRWAKTPYVAGHQAILDAFIKLFESEASGNLKPPAAQFFDMFRGKLVQLVKDSVALVGACEGPCYVEVYGEDYDRSKVPAYLPALSHFQLHFHDIGNDKAVQQAWEDCLKACGAELPALEEGLGSSPAKRALVYMLSMGEDISYLRLCNALCFEQCEFQYD